MAWTKVKTGLVAGAMVGLMGVGAVSLIEYYQHDSPPAQTGKLKLPMGPVQPMVAKGNGYVVVLGSDGSLWSCGEEPLGWPVLGLGSNVTKTVSLRRIGSDNDWVDVSTGTYNSLAVKSDGTIWAWGGNFAYQLGDGTKVSRVTPVRSVPGNDWAQVAVGDGCSFAIKNDGTLWTWGQNAMGDMGIGNAKESRTAVQVGTSSNWTKIWAGFVQTVGLQSDGSLWFWGSFTGDSRGSDRLSVPTRISPDTNWVDLCFGYFTVFAIKSDGTLWSWGNKANYYTGADASKNTTPIQVGTDSDWQSCAAPAGGFYTLLKKKDGSLWAMDASEHRIVKPAADYKPIQFRKIDLNEDIVAYTAGSDNIGIVLTREGEIWTWGNVMGKHSPEDFEGPNHQYNRPNFKVMKSPWQLSMVDAGQ